MTTPTRRPAGLGTPRTLSLTEGTINYFEAGPPEGPVILFVHGLLVNADLWRKVVPDMALEGFRALAVDWPLGSHHTPMPDADLSPIGVADLIASFMSELDLRDVTIVANDTGGALTQILMTRNPERIGRVVLTPSDSFERFFPPMFMLLPRLARIPGGTTLIVRSLQFHSVQKLPLAFGHLAKRSMPRETLDSYVKPSRRNRNIRRDLRTFLRDVHNHYTIDAASQLSEFTQPVLLAWSTEDQLFPISLAERLAKILPHATVERIDDALTFVPEDQPEILVRLVTQFAKTDAPT